MARKLFALILTLAVLFTASSAFADVKIAFSQIGQESDWRTANTDDLTKAIQGHPGWTLITPIMRTREERDFTTTFTTTKRPHKHRQHHY